jgi:hypothetical protein
MAIGPAAEAVRLAGDAASELKPQLEQLLRQTLAGYATPDGVVLGSSTWIVKAQAPRSASSASSSR